MSPPVLGYVSNMVNSHSLLLCLHKMSGKHNPSVSKIDDSSCVLIGATRGTWVEWLNGMVASKVNNQELGSTLLIFISAVAQLQRGIVMCVRSL